MRERKPGWVRPFELDPATAEVEPEPVSSAPAPTASDGTQGPRVAAAARRSNIWRRLGWLGLMAAILAVTLETADRLLDRIVSDPLTGWPMAILITMVAVSALSLLGRELVQLWRLQRRTILRETATRLASSDLHGSAAGLIADVTGGLPSDPALAQAIASYRRQLDDSLSDSEHLRLYERNVLVAVDRRAYRLVLESARDIGLLTAISPYGLLDGLLVLWRTTLMVRAVARIYGIAPTPMATLALMRRCLRNAALAGLADVATHAVLEHAGASLAAMLSARAGQGAGNALLAAKLGIEAIKEARPMPFVAAEPPSLRQIRKALLSGDRATAKILRDEI